MQYFFLTKKCNRYLFGWLGYFDPPTCTTTFSAEGAICIFSCGSGYGQRGAKFIECQSEGRWSDYTYYCEGNYLLIVILQHLNILSYYDLPCVII